MVDATRQPELSPQPALADPWGTVEQVSQAIRAIDDKYLIRFQAYDKAIQLLQDSSNRSPTTAELAKELIALKEHTSTETQRTADYSLEAQAALKELVFEKFASVQTQFDQNKTALDAALNAAKEAVAEQNKSNTLAINKSEEAFKKLLDSSSNRVDATEKSTDGKISDLKDRIGAIENRMAGRQEQSSDTRLSLGAIVGLISVCFVFISLLIAAVGLAVKF